MAKNESVRLVAPNGAAVSVSAEKAERLLADSSWSKPAAKKSASTKSDSK